MRRELIPDLVSSRDKSRDGPDTICSCPEVERSRDVLCRPLVRDAIILKSCLDDSHRERRETVKSPTTPNKVIVVVVRTL